MISPLHPDIECFFKARYPDRDSVFESRHKLHGMPVDGYWDLVDPAENLILNTVAMVHEGEPILYYLRTGRRYGSHNQFWEVAEYTEEEMLKVIKLKAFL